jgi:hypothetical protein
MDDPRYRYATELTRACLELATRERRWAEISAFSYPEESRSFMNRYVYRWRLPS